MGMRREERVGGDDTVTTTPSSQPAFERKKAGTAVVASAVLLAVVGFFAPPVVVADVLIPPFALHAGLVLSALIAVTWVGIRTSRPKIFGRLATGLLCLSLGTLHVLFSLVVTKLTILEPVGPDGCRVVARESTSFKSGEGSLGTVGSHGGPVWMQVHYSVDEGGTPIRDGTAHLKWSRDGSASLSIPEAYGFDPEGPDLSCH